MVDCRGCRAQPGPRVPDGYRGRDFDRLSDAGWRASTPRLRGRWRARLLTVSQAAGPAARKRPTRNVSSAPNFCQGEFTVRQRCLAADRCGRLPPEPCGPRRGNPGGGDTGVSEMGDRGIGGCPIASLSSLQQQAMAESSRFHDLRAEGAFSDRRRRQLIAGAVTDFSSNTAASGRPSPCEPPIGSRQRYREAIHDGTWQPRQGQPESGVQE